MRDHIELLIEFDCGDASSKHLVDWAIAQIQEEKESESLLELAWQSCPGSADARSLFLAAMEELGYSLPSYSIRKNLIAKNIAAKILNGEKNINDACAELGEISKELDSPDNLAVFELLAHTQYDHESVGINKDSIQPEIRAAAAELLKNV